MERCPNCRARYQEGGQCRRCGMELTQLLAAESGANRLIREALACIADGDSGNATAALARALTLRRDPLIELLLEFAADQREARASTDNPLWLP